MDAVALCEEYRRLGGPLSFWDEDGQAYMGRSQLGAGPIYLHRMTPDGKTLLDDGKIIYTGPVAEGTKFYKRHGYYYLSIPEGGVGEGWQTILRSKISMDHTKESSLGTGKHYCKWSSSRGFSRYA